MGYRVNILWYGDCDNSSLTQLISLAFKTAFNLNIIILNVVFVLEIIAIVKLASILESE